MKTFYIRSLISTHVYTYIKENCKIIMDIKNKMSVVEKIYIYFYSFPGDNTVSTFWSTHSEILDKN